MAPARFLIDKSALARTHLPQVGSRVAALLDAGLLATCGMASLELLFSAPNGADHARLRALTDGPLEWLPTEDVDFRRAIDVHASLAQAGTHRSVALPDLLLAAVAERHRVGVLHYDSDFDTIAEITGQPMQWVVPRGSVT
jgi:predicted nucleic acid-binding protein